MVFQAAQAIRNYMKQIYPIILLNKSGALKRVAVKGNKVLYKNSSWDLVDAADADSSFIAKVDTKTLPDSLKNKSRTELKQIVKTKKTVKGNPSGKKLKR
jgi:hypothetical protein